MIKKILTPFLILWQALIVCAFPFITCLIYAPLTSFFLLIRVPRLAGWAILMWAKTMFFLLLIPIEIEGKEHIDPNKRYIVIANHSSFLDIPLLAILFGTPLSWVLKDSLLKIPILNIAFLLGVGIPIPRGNAKKSQEQLNQRAKMLKKKINPNILIYPEGTRSKTGEIGEFKKGFVRLMRNEEMDLLPITLCGVYRFCSSQQWPPNPHSRLKIVIHPPQPYTELQHWDDRDIAIKMKELIKHSYYA